MKASARSFNALQVLVYFLDIIFLGIHAIVKIIMKVQAVLYI